MSAPLGERCYSCGHSMFVHRETPGDPILRIRHHSPSVLHDCDERCASEIVGLKPRPLGECLAQNGRLQCRCTAHQRQVA